MEDCLFCKIIAGEVPAQKIYEDDDTFAFLSINPVNKGHTLVSPKRHYENIHDISKENFSALMETVRKLSSVVKVATGAAGINIGINNGSVAGQIIFHLHVHIIPRLPDDGHRHWRGENYKGDEIDLIAAKIRHESEKLK